MLAKIIEKHVNGFSDIGDLQQPEIFSLEEYLTPPDTSSVADTESKTAQNKQPSKKLKLEKTYAESSDLDLNETVSGQLDVNRTEKSVPTTEHRKKAVARQLITVASSVILTFLATTLVTSTSYVPDFLNQYFSLQTRQQAYDEALKKTFIAAITQNGMSLFEDPEVLLNLTPSVNALDLSSDPDILTNKAHTRAVLLSLQQQLKKADVQKSLEEALVMNSKTLSWPIKNFSLDSNKIDHPENFPGIHIAADSGTAVVAVEKGEVIHVESTKNGYGTLILVQHPNDIMAVYAKNQKSLVSAGDIVNRGQKLGETGATNLHKKPGLYFEIRYNGTAENPFHHLASL